MRKTNRIILILMAVAIAVLYAIVLIDPDEKTQPPTTGTVATTGSVIKMAYVNSDSLLENYSYYQALKEDLEKEHNRLSNQINQQARSLENEIQNYQETAMELSSSQRQEKEEVLYKKQQDLLKKREQLLGELGEKEQDLQDQLHSDLTDYIKEYNHDKGYTIIFGYSRGGGILFADDALDITDDIIQGLNNRTR